MFLRLSKLANRQRGFGFRLSGALVGVLFAACGGGHFTAGSGGSGNAGSAGSALTGGDTSAAGESGASGDAGSAGSAALGGTGGIEAGAGSAGKGAGGCTDCDASKGMYCQQGTAKCRSCADFSRLEFSE